MAAPGNGQTWFFHAALYGRSARRTPDDMALLAAVCPTCGVSYVSAVDRRAPADTDADVRAYPEALAAVAAAGRHLAAECPDHAARFAVRPG